jgi:hypothetical protein
VTRTEGWESAATLDDARRPTLHIIPKRERARGMSNLAVSNQGVQAGSRGSCGPLPGAYTWILFKFESSHPSTYSSRSRNGMSPRRPPEFWRFCGCTAALCGPSLACYRFDIGQE